MGNNRNAASTACPDLLTSMLTQLAKCRDLMETLVLHGQAKAKSGAIPHSKIRTILPMLGILSILDYVVAKRVYLVADAFSEKLPFGFLECAKRHRQCLDIAFPASIVIERSLDKFYQAAISQQDIKQYYESLQPLKVANWIGSVMEKDALAATSLRMHTCPLVVLRSGGYEAAFKSRTGGTFTGSRSAGAVGRIPLLETVHSRMHFWFGFCFKAADKHFALATFVDNLVVPANTPVNASTIQRDIEEHLQRRWGLQLGADSKELVICKGYQGPMSDLREWHVRDCMRILRHWLSSDGGCRRCVQETTAAVLRAFHANARAGLKQARERVKLRFLDSCVLPIARSKWARWVSTQQIASQLDSMQPSMIAALMGIVPHCGEERDQFRARRHRKMSTLARQSGSSSTRWVVSIVSWAAHGHRGHDERCWSPHVLKWRDNSWLLLQRFMCSGMHEMLTRTRVCPGRPFTRWAQGLEVARQRVK